MTGAAGGPGDAAVHPHASDATARLRPLAREDLARVAGLERELFGASAWSPAMLAEELHGPGRHYVAAVPVAVPDAGMPDAGMPDAGMPDAGMPDAGMPDAGMPHAAPGAAEAGPSDVIGYAGLWFDGEDAQVMTIGVAAEHQGRRVGHLLMSWLLDRARELGARSVLLEVRVDNEPALALYERFGFVRTGRRRGYYQPENADAWTMRVDLTADAPTDVVGGGRTLR
jgi:ribosomal-protein-alanine N-acetyltransferase